MSRHRRLKLAHLASTVWFVICIGYIFVLALRQAGVKWWVVFSLSGHGVLIILILISLYLFAIFRGISSSQKVQMEHPLSNTSHYKAFYVITPLLGGIAGCLGMMGVSTTAQFILGVALGTLATTFFVWVIIDPLVGLLESLLPPTSRKHRAQRLALAHALRQKRKDDNERLISEVLARAKSEKQYWQQLLKPQAHELAALLTADNIDYKKAEREAAGMGVNAWQIGGRDCMQELHDMAIAIAQKKNQNDYIVDYIGVWWNGIGNWRQLSVI